MFVFPQLILFVLTLGIPGAELVIAFIIMLVPEEKTGLLVEALQAWKDLERLEKKKARLLALCVECSRDEILSEIELEIAACKSSINRLRRQIRLAEIRQDEFMADDTVELQLSEDVSDLEKLKAQREELISYAPGELREMFISFLGERVVVSERNFQRLAEAYCNYDSPDENSREGTVPEPELPMVEVTIPELCLACPGESFTSSIFAVS